MNKSTPWLLLPALLALSLPAGCSLSPPSPFILMETPVKTPPGKVSGMVAVGGGVGGMGNLVWGGPGAAGRLRIGNRGPGDLGISANYALLMNRESNSTGFLHEWGFDLHYKFFAGGGFMFTPGVGLSGLDDGVAINVSGAMTLSGTSGGLIPYAGLFFSYSRGLHGPTVSDLNSFYAVMTLGLNHPLDGSGPLRNIFVELSGGPVITWYRDKEHRTLEHYTVGAACLSIGFQLGPGGMDIPRSP